MTINVKVTFPKNLDKRLKQAQQEALKTAKRVLDDEIVPTIERGASPVKPGKRYKAYSESYKEQIRAGRFAGKRVRPVNLKVSGDLLKSYSSKIANGKLTIGFSDFKAKFHDRLGAGKSKVIRRMLPRNGEKFNLNIQDRLIKEVTNAVVRFFK